MGNNSSTPAAAAAPRGLWIRPGDDFVAVGSRGDKTWALRGPKGLSGKVKLTQIKPGGTARVDAHTLQYTPACPAEDGASPSADVLVTTAPGDVKPSACVLLRSGERTMHPVGDKVEWVTGALRKDTCPDDYRRFAFVANDKDVPAGAPLPGGEDVNIRVYRVGDKRPWALRTPAKDHDDPDVDMGEGASSWRLYRTSGWVWSAKDKCRPWSIAADAIRAAPPYTCELPSQAADGSWSVECYTPTQDKLFGTEAECREWQASQDGGSNNGGNGGGNGGGNNGGSDNDKGGSDNNNGGNNGGGGDNGSDNNKGGNTPKPPPKPKPQPTPNDPPKKPNDYTTVIVLVMVAMVLVMAALLAARYSGMI